MPDWEAYVRDRIDTANLPTGRGAEIVEELAQHLAERYDEAKASGSTEEQAQAAAAACLPDRAELASAAVPATPRRQAPPPAQGHAGGFVAGFVQDARYAWRVLARTPAFTLVAVATLALGIGGTTAIFSVTNAVLLRPLPYADPVGLVEVGHAGDAGTSTVGYATYMDWRNGSAALETLSAVRSWSPTLVTADGPERLHGMRVTHGFFGMLRVRPALGRLFTAADDRPGESRRVAVLSHRLWQRRFGGDHGVVGRLVDIDGDQFRVVGVLPPDFEPLVSGHFYQPAEVWSPLGYDASLPYACRSCQHLRVLGRLEEGVAPGAARAELEAIQRTLLAAHPDDYRDAAIAVVPLHDAIVSGIRPVLRILMAAIVIVLGIAVANLAGLLLARGAARRREMAVRAALGARVGRVVRQLLTETILLSALGGVAGLAVAAWVTPLLMSLAPVDIPRLDDVRMDRVALAFAAAITLACGIFVGLAPALRLARPDLAEAIRAGGRANRGGRGGLWRSALVAGQVALAVVLMAGAGLMVRTMAGLLTVAPGFDPRGVLTLHVSAVGTQFDDAERVLAFQADVLDRVGALPGIGAAAFASQVPFGGNSDRYGLTIASRPELGPGERPAPERYAVTPGYFAALRIPLLRGRLLDDGDRRDTEPVVLVNATAASRIWPGGDAIGGRVRLGGAEAPFRKVVGVVGDVRHDDLSAPAPLQMYLPQTQMTDAYLTLVVRRFGDPLGALPGIRAAIAAAAPVVPVYDVEPLEDLIARSVAQRRFLMRLLTALAVLALLLATVGLYGIVAWWVTQRLPEIAVRIALGAPPGRIIRLVMLRGAFPVAAGALGGVAIALAATRYLESQLYGVGPRDPLILAAIVAVVLAATLTANLLPARRAARVDPLELLGAD